MRISLIDVLKSAFVYAATCDDQILPLFAGKYLIMEHGPTWKCNGKSMFQDVNLKIIGKWVQRVEIRLVSTFDQKIIVFEELKKIFIK